MPIVHCCRSLAQFNQSSEVYSANWLTCITGIAYTYRSFFIDSLEYFPQFDMYDMYDMYDMNCLHVLRVLLTRIAAFTYLNIFLNMTWFLLHWKQEFISMCQVQKNQVPLSNFFIWLQYIWFKTRLKTHSMLLREN